MSRSLRIGFIGNPNCGKTTLFNAFTGANLKVANWPGVTVEKKEGQYTYQNITHTLIDLPGTYSLTSYTMEEIVARDYIISDEVDVLVNVVDASNLERNLYLTLQLLELNKPMVIALNMMDIVAKRKMEIDMHRLPEMLGVPVVSVCARKRQGLQSLMHAVIHHQDQIVTDPLIHEHDSISKHRHDHHAEFAMVYQDKMEDLIDDVSDKLHQQYPNISNLRYHAIKYLENDQAIRKQYPIAMEVANYESTIINEKYDFIEEIVKECLINKEKVAEFTDRIDRMLTHRFWGIIWFLIIMAFVFFLTFTIGDFFSGYVEQFISLLSEDLNDLLTKLQVASIIRYLILDGIIAGVGGIIAFLPNIIILFFALAILEDSGYMSRVAYVMDDIMSSLGLSGRSFIPLLLGFGCSVPAIMASRSLESKKDRLKTMLITPFMSCSARLPIYILFSHMFFGKYAMIAAYSMYLLGLIVAIAVAFLWHLFDRKSHDNPLLIELPEYKLPSARTVYIYVYEKVIDFLSKAGTTIFIASIVMWILLNFSFNGYTTDMTTSFAAMIGKQIVWLFAPIGLGFWQIVVAIIAGISAKEVVVSSSAVLFSIANINSVQGMEMMQASLQAIGFTALNAYCLMVFCLLYVPCFGTIMTIKKESESWRYTLAVVMFQLVVAWVVTFVVYQIGSLIL
ncbi:MAG: ferrous iron transport protein B [Erysipelotrichaceae bacterium]|nr:ferrous iron transport protein B [Erysipelotrichaceae bacterium]MDY5252094.1 ferrous iron transport protein B [Erysipelotrichaceae bacterium]